ncbi:MAG: ABC transporter ATP-binding protein [Caldilinea sp.]|nr:ABC transporter ATP-binding protein [Caldilineaceae bacterium]MCB9125670.1 ABC transporter ATP-binding protein [Caldilineaceae bacterium]MCO5210824.1 ABC transporter ATP-binding protein [Caldilinea sp.]MCW5841547.1 ABC transporter ATP-binding protein [Caldilinea sp.]HRW50455.1 ABC transporter ATP-binding protein [Caldilinea sp.]
MPDYLIDAWELHKSFGETRAVDGVSLSVAAGEIYGLVGPDGAGKTTVMRLLCGALTLDDGDVEIGGYDIRRQVERAREQIGYLAQRFSLYEELTVQENLRFFAEVRGLQPSQWAPRSQEILAFVGLEPFRDRRAGQLSGGMKQKLGLALALINEPRVLLLDEPTTGVDPVTRQDFWRLILPLLRRGNLAVLVSTPYMDEALRCTRIGFMRGGRIISEGPPADLRRRLDGRILELAGSPDKLLVEMARRDPGVETAERFGNRFHLRVAPGQAQAVLARLGPAIQAAGGTVEELAIIDPQLEDVFIELAEHQA